MHCKMTKYVNSVEFIHTMLAMEIDSLPTPTAAYCHQVECQSHTTLEKYYILLIKVC